jgi:hypothetical protein
MIDPVWLGAVSIIVGGGGLTTAVVAIRKSRPEIKKMDADTAAVIATTAGKWVLDADDRMAELAAELKANAAELRLIKANQRAHDELLAVHVRWDRQVLAALEDAGITHLPAPPPMYLPQTG